MWEVFEKGGYLMYPIALCSILALGIFLERLWVFSRVRREVRELAHRVEPLAAKGRLEEATTVCHQSESPMSRIFLAALRAAGRSREQVKAVVEETGRRESGSLAAVSAPAGNDRHDCPADGSARHGAGHDPGVQRDRSAGDGHSGDSGRRHFGGADYHRFGHDRGHSGDFLAHRYLSGRLEYLAMEMEEYSLRLVDLLGE